KRSRNPPRSTPFPYTTLFRSLALIAIVRSLHVQRAMLEEEQARQLADKHVRWLDGAYKDISEAFDSRVAQDITLRDILEGYIGVDRKSTRLNSSHLVISYAVF